MTEKNKKIKTPLNSLRKVVKRLPDNVSWEDALRKITKERIESAFNKARYEFNDYKNEIVKTRFIYGCLLFCALLSGIRVFYCYPSLIGNSASVWLNKITLIIFSSFCYSIVFWFYVIILSNWYIIAKVTGKPSWNKIKKTYKYNKYNSVIKLIFSIVILLLIFYLNTKSSVLLFFLISAFTFLIFSTSLTSEPPIIFFISNTMQESIEFHSKLVTILEPLRINSLFLPKIDGDIFEILIMEHQSEIKKNIMIDAVYKFPLISKFIVYDFRYFNNNLIKAIDNIPELPKDNNEILLIDDDTNISQISNYLKEKRIDNIMKEEEILSFFKNKRLN